MVEACGPASADALRAAKIAHFALGWFLGMGFSRVALFKTELRKRLQSVTRPDALCSPIRWGVFLPQWIVQILHKALMSASYTLTQAK